MKLFSLKTIGIISMLSLVAAVLIAQAVPQPAAERSWHWIKFFGQTVQVYGAELPDGRIRYWDIDKSRIAPSVKERDATDQPPIIPPGLTPVHPSPQSDGGPVTRNYGIAIDKLASDTRTIRASDPETLDRVIEQARKKPSCPDDDSDKDPAPAFVPPPSGNGDLIAYGVACALGIAAAVVLMTNKNASPK